MAGICGAWTAVMATLRITGSCVLFVQGIAMNCPLCQTLVQSGEHHECRIKSETPLPRRKACKTVR